jgi:hypothetical protein
VEPRNENDLFSAIVYNSKKTTDGILSLCTIDTILMPRELFCFNSEIRLMIYWGHFSSRFDHKLCKNKFLGTHVKARLKMKEVAESILSIR